ncbi:helix-turn-helix domain-containing protein [Embleya sp. MST-111070]|uniref:helix-turn-helix domain-containing protein n=1 Tax=Embleya sp. MST-111070 TaxID=3398231 RepID=UPI003F736125
MPRGMTPFSGAALQKARAHHGMSVAALARLVGCGKAQIIEYEQGRRAPEPARLVRLATELAVPPLVLMGVNPRRTTLADLRAAAGLTADELATVLGMSRTTYRLLETQGHFPPGRDETIVKLTARLGPYRTVQRALANVSRERKAEILRITEILDELMYAPNVPARVSADDPYLRRLAELSRCPTQQLRRLLNHLLDSGRQLIVVDYIGQVQARFAQHDTVRQNANTLREQARTELQSWPHLAADAIDWLPEALTQRQWKAVVRLSAAEHVEGIPGLPVREVAALESLLHRTLTGYPRAGDMRHLPRIAPFRLVYGPAGERLRFSARGRHYCTTTSPIYAALYPTAGTFTPFRSTSPRPRAGT